ncbi:MAG: transglutaminase domain-containing protein [Ruminococcus sp.]|nr:transglutaminase domain-containing protein [Ruminococcus sp.]
MFIKRLVAFTAAALMLAGGWAQDIADLAGAEIVVSAKDFTYASGVTESQIEAAANAFVSEKIKAGMTTYEKVVEIMKFVSDGEYYDGEGHSGSYDLIVSKRGNCSGATASVEYLCKKLGIQCYYRTAKYDDNSTVPYGTVTDHRNNVINIDGISYIADALFNNNYILVKATDFTKYYFGKGKCDGTFVYHVLNDGAVEIDEVLAFGLKSLTFPSQLGGKPVNNIYNIINWADKSSIESVCKHV